MAGWTTSMEALIQALKKLPGVGLRTAERYAFFLLSQPSSFAKELTEAILKVKQTIGFCRVCFNLADGDLCSICQDPARDKSVLCVVEDHRSIRAIEKGGGFKGVYHVLLGALSPLDGVGPRELRVQELKSRVKDSAILEVVLATDSDLEGEATALYLVRELKTLGRGESLRVSRLAFGIPMGSSIEYADQVTLSRALEGRRSL